MTTIEIIRELLKKPVVSPNDLEHGTDRAFDPWDAFPCFYGSYSRAFDDMAILVLSNIAEGKFGASAGEGLAHEMFREVLCTSGLCDYGTSPRGCFPDWGSGFEEVLPRLIEKWKEYRDAGWGEGL